MGSKVPGDQEREGLKITSRGGKPRKESEAQESHVLSSPMSL